MIKKFELRNYKNFKDNIVVNFGKVGSYEFGTDCITDNLISKMLIYGRNATGKTNLGKALIDISLTLNGYSWSNNGIFLNADSKETTAMFAYTFQFADDEVVYRYTRISGTELRDEELIINGKQIFQCYFGKEKKVNCDLDYLNAEETVINRFLQSKDVDNETENYEVQQIPFLRWIIGNIALKNMGIKYLCICNCRL